MKARLCALAAYAVLGPITGPLAAGALRSLRNGDKVLAGLYLAAIPAAFGLLSLVAAWSVGALHA